VVAQDTGWGQWLAPGDGVLPFKTAAEAAAAIDEVARDYTRHARAARAAAERYFDSDKVLPGLLDAVGAGA
jgi:hypothetical protein